MGNALLRQAGIIVDPVHRIEAGDRIDSHGVYRALDQKLSHRLTCLLQRRDPAVTQSL